MIVCQRQFCCASDLFCCGVIDACMLLLGKYMLKSEFCSWIAGRILWHGFLYQMALAVFALENRLHLQMSFSAQRFNLSNIRNNTSRTRRASIWPFVLEVYMPEPKDCINLMICSWSLICLNGNDLFFFSASENNSWRTEEVKEPYQWTNFSC